MLTYEHRMTLYLWRRKNRAHPVTDLAPISLRIEIDGFERTEFATGVSATAAQWSAGAKRLSPGPGLSRPERELLQQANNKLAERLLAGERAYALLKAQGHNPSPVEVRHLLKGGAVVSRRLSEVLDLLEGVLLTRGRARSTVLSLRSVRQKLLTYLRKHGGVSFPLASVSLQWLRGWERWLLGAHPPSTTQIYVGVLLQAVKEAAHEGWLPLNPLADYAYQSERDPAEKRHLSPEEVARLQQALSGLALPLYKATFMFLASCYTGLSYVDYCRLAREPALFLVPAADPISGRQVRGILLQRQKTKRSTEQTWTPLLPQATRLLDSHEGPMPDLGPTRVNLSLKKVAGLFALSLPDLKFKDARSTFSQITREQFGLSVAAELARHSEQVASKHYNSASPEEVLRKLHILGAELSYN
ncbi:hypothetical protein [Hymenobacter lapidiphilus]|uniref:Integrase n=1 Tax=Hymenobacter lapidiphilus TaxID=2608003 RepID=A0A7Y7U745_9BACT|nr:hypothetical protein [Hymenobacter lapidiphilus]NVO33466.1 hypothetical protein [Hymenobacter lapidiphilus]